MIVVRRLTTSCLSYLFVVCNDTATTEIYTYGHTLSLHDALPSSFSSRITGRSGKSRSGGARAARALASKVQQPQRCWSAGSTSASQPSLGRSEEHTSELQSLMRISYAVFCLKKKQKNTRPSSSP